SPFGCSARRSEAHRQCARSSRGATSSDGPARSGRSTTSGRGFTGSSRASPISDIPRAMKAFIPFVSASSSSGLVRAISTSSPHGPKPRRTAAKAARAAADVFLRRRLFKRVSDGKIIAPDFVSLHYPRYWHYDFLGGLTAMTQVGRIADPRCADALDLLEARRLPDGGWPAEKRYYKVSPKAMVTNADYVNWGGTSRKRMNPWVTVDALAVLRAAGRLDN